MLQAQENIVALEYYVDTDPGQGAATSIPITTGQDIDINFTIPVSGMGLSIGTHLLVIRAQQATGEWGVYESRLFYIQENVPAEPPVADIDMLEYFIDEDPGLDGGTTVSISTGAEIDISQLVPTGVLTEGFHNISYRARNTNGDWGFYENRIFYLQPPVSNNPTPPDITEMEYFFDNDPGQGNATSFSITTGTIVDIDQLLIPNSLSQGLHLIGIRAKNDNGDWGFAETRKIYINPAGEAEPAPAEITKLEYFFNDDPGLGSGTAIEVDPDAIDVDIASILLPTEETIPVGTNSITFRALNTNGLWSFSETREFDVQDDCDQPTAGFSVELACEGETVNFIDNSTDTQIDAEYRWYFDGDEAPDDFTSGNTSYTFQNSGEYTISLAISQGQICYDSISQVITIKEKPVVVFSTDRVSEVETTSFTVDQFDVEPGSIWEWDFQTDGIIDDNTTGNTTFNFGSEGSYLTTLTVTDGNGCGTTYSKLVFVDEEGDGSSGPSANFTAPNTCAGEIKNYTDLSSNIPGGSTYSWDFDGDGIEDDNTVGSTQFNFTSAGVFTSELVIDTGSEIITHSEIVEVLDFPIADFQASETCVGNSTLFTDLSSMVEPTATYEWDFDNDGVIDSNTQGDVSFTYPSAGSYSAVLVINNGSGCFDTRVQTVAVIVQPNVDFTFDTACAGTETQFLNNSTAISATALYEWDFNNDGIVDSNLENPFFAFNSPGDYDVTLLIDNGATCTSQTTKTVSISEEAIADFTVGAGCAGETVTFTNNSLNVSPSAIFSWDFDNNGTTDSNESGSTTTFTYPSSGTYTVALTIDNGNNCIVESSESIEIRSTPTSAFSVESVCEGTPTSFVNNSSGLLPGTTFSWDFNDDGIVDSNSANPTFEYADDGNYEVTLLVDNGSGCTDETTQTVNIIGLPSVDFTYSAGCIGEEVIFTDNSSNVTGSASYRWDFNGDGIEDDNTPGNASFTYSGLGPYFAELLIDNGNGCIESLTVEVEFSSSPSPDFNASEACLGEETILNDLTTNVNNTATYQWDFDGDGNIDSSIPGSTSYQFQEAGNYTTTLTVSNNGCEASIERLIIVNELPSIQLDADRTTCSDEEITLDPGPGFLNYSWSTGSNDQIIVVSESGTYSVVVEDENGCSASDEIVINEGALPTADFATQIELFDFSSIVTFQNQSENGETFSWDFGDGATSDLENPIHEYTDIDIFNGSIFEVCLTVTNSCDVTEYCELVPLLVTKAEESLTESGLLVYPNPNMGKFKVKQNQTANIEYLWLFSAQGKLIQTASMNNKNEHTFKNLKAGAYYLRGREGDVYYGQKIIVN